MSCSRHIAVDFSASVILNFTGSFLFIVGDFMNEKIITECCLPQLKLCFAGTCSS